ncbi:MAG: hypothetical protein JWP97_6843 [Labilithrix sp.]|nr:hypothetical protein [Labilithrix sp.]
MKVSRPRSSKARAEAATKLPEPASTSEPAASAPPPPAPHAPAAQDAAPPSFEPAASEPAAQDLAPSALEPAAQDALPAALVHTTKSKTPRVPSNTSRGPLSVSFISPDGTMIRLVRNAKKKKQAVPIDIPDEDLPMRPVNFFEMIPNLLPLLTDLDGYAVNGFYHNRCAKLHQVLRQVGEDSFFKVQYAIRYLVTLSEAIAQVGVKHYLLLTLSNGNHFPLMCNNGHKGGSKIVIQFLAVKKRSWADASETLSKGACGCHLVEHSEWFPKFLNPHSCGGRFFQSAVKAMADRLPGMASFEGAVANYEPFEFSVRKYTPPSVSLSLARAAKVQEDADVKEGDSTCSDGESSKPASSSTSACCSSAASSSTPSPFWSGPLAMSGGSSCNSSLASVSSSCSSNSSSASSSSSFSLPSCSSSTTCSSSSSAAPRTGVSSVPPAAVSAAPSSQPAAVLAAKLAASKSAKPAASKPAASKPAASQPAASLAAGGQPAASLTVGPAGPVNQLVPVPAPLTAFTPAGTVITDAGSFSRWRAQQQSRIFKAEKAQDARRAKLERAKDAVDQAV